MPIFWNALIVIYSVYGKQPREIAGFIFNEEYDMALVKKCKKWRMRL